MRSLIRLTSLILAALLVFAFAPSETTPPSPRPLPASNSWGWPLAGRPVVAHPFDPPAKPWLPGHRGVDLFAAQGAPVIAPVTGLVTFVGVVVNRPVITITTPEGLRISLEPVDSSLQRGDAVSRGDLLGTVEGPTHCDAAPPAAQNTVEQNTVEQTSTLAVSHRISTARTTPNSCLHWGVRRGEEYLNPLQFVLDLRPSVLLPLISSSLLSQPSLPSLPRQRTRVASCKGQH